MNEPGTFGDWIVPGLLPPGDHQAAATADARRQWPGPELRAGLRLRHRQNTDLAPTPYCTNSDNIHGDHHEFEPWPCAPIRLLAALEAVEAAAADMLPAAHLLAGHRDMLVNACAIAWGASLPSDADLRDCGTCTPDRPCDTHNAARAAAANYLHLEQVLRGYLPVPAGLSPPAAWLTEWGADISVALTVASNLLDHAVEACTVCVSPDEPCANHKADRANARRFRDARQAMPR